jgi:hypothetical protein
MLIGNKNPLRAIRDEIFPIKKISSDQIKILFIYIKKKACLTHSFYFRIGFINMHYIFPDFHFLLENFTDEIYPFDSLGQNSSL